MRKTFCFSILVLLTIKSFAVNQNHGSFFLKADHFLKKVVTGGYVDYEIAKRSDKLIEELVNLIGSANPEAQSNDYQKAFYINAYNILVIRSILSFYPVSSPKDIDGFFDKKQHKIAGAWLSLSDLEHKIIRPKFQDARIHFALVCAAKSCPDLLTTAYTPSNIDVLLNQQTKKTLNDPEFVKLASGGKNLKLSKIFEWYTEEFTVDGKQDIIGFINRYRDRKIDKNISITFSEYDWSLNAPQ